MIRLRSLSAGIFLCASPVFALTFSECQAAHFTAGQLSNPSISGANADPDGDGRSDYQGSLDGTGPLTAGPQFLCRLFRLTGNGSFRFLPGFTAPSSRIAS